jgi:C_GCAxxG_C_C family probable redox protein
MNENIALEARNKAGGYFKEGYNCAEAMFLTFREYLAPELDKEMVRLFTGFGSGVGESGCMCGALMGAITGLNMLKGRVSNQEDRSLSYDYAREFHDRFVDKFGTTCCRALNPYPFDTKEHLRNCLKITGNTAKLLVEYIEEKGLHSFK